MSDTSGYVYLFKIGNSYKIGASKNLPERMKSLQTGSVDDIKLEHTIYTDTPYQLEKQLHYRFKHKRIRREFFNLDNDDIVYIKNIKADWSNDHFLEKGVVGNSDKDILNFLSADNIDIVNMKKYKLPIDIQADLQINKISNKVDFNSLFKLLPYDNVWIEGKQHCRDDNSWLLLLQRILLVFFKIDVINHTKFHSKQYFNFGVNFIREDNRLIRFNVFKSFDDSDKLNLIVNGYIVHNVNNIDTILTSQNKLTRFKCDLCRDCTVSCSKTLGFTLDCEIDGVCAPIQTMACARKRSTSLHSLKENALEVLFNYQTPDSDLAKINFTKSHFLALCSYQKFITAFMIETVTRALEYFNQDATHIIKSKPITDSTGKTESKYIQNNEWHLITNSNKVIYHYLHSDDTNKDRKSPISHWRRSHLRKLLNKIIRVRESFIGGDTKIDKANNKVYTLVK